VIVIDVILMLMEIEMTMMIDVIAVKMNQSGLVLVGITVRVHGVLFFEVV
jgi:hypothetical protein